MGLDPVNSTVTATKSEIRYSRRMGLDPTGGAAISGEGVGSEERKERRKGMGLGPTGGAAIAAIMVMANVLSFGVAN